MKQKHGSVKDAFYVLHLMKGFVRDALKTKLPSSIREWTKNAGKIAEDKLREDFHLIQMELSQIIYDDVVTSGGAFNKANGRINHAYSQQVLLYFLYYRLIILNLFILLTNIYPNPSPGICINTYSVDLFFSLPGTRFELVTRGFSVLCSTN